MDVGDTQGELRRLSAGTVRRIPRVFPNAEFHMDASEQALLLTLRPLLFSPTSVSFLPLQFRHQGRPRRLLRSLLAIYYPQIRAMSAMLEDQDEDVRIAVRALGDMRNGSGNGGSATRECVFRLPDPIQVTPLEMSPHLACIPPQRHCDIRQRNDMLNERFTATPTRTPALSIASTSSLPTTSLPSPASFSSFHYNDKKDYPDDEEEFQRDYLSRDSNDSYRPTDEADLVERMSHLPLVGGALRAYEQGKASSRVVKVCVSPVFFWPIADCFLRISLPPSIQPFCIRVNWTFTHANLYINI